MPQRVALLALLLCASAGWGAELRTLKGEVIEGEVVSINDKEIVLAKGDEKKTFPITQIVHVDYKATPKLPLDAKYADIELNDGTLLHCAEFTWKGKEITAKLLTEGQEVKIPLNAVANILRDAQNEKRRKDWNDRLAQLKKAKHDYVARDTDGVINAIQCTIDEADDKGDNVKFKFQGADKVLPQANYVGFIFYRELDPKAPPVLCKLTDAHRDLVMVSGVALKEGVLTVSTPAGVTVPYKTENVAKLDYSTANLAYLSDLEPSKVEETSTEERVEHYRKDRNMDDRPLRVQGQVFTKGLALHATTVLEFQLKGEYREFRAVAGIDDQVGGHNRPVVLKIDADGKEVYRQKFSRKDAKERARPVNLNVKDVQVLTITVTREESDFLDLGLHLDLADARVSK